MKSTTTFKQFHEMTTGMAFGDGGAVSFNHGGDVPGGSDFYAPNDARLPKILGPVQTRKGAINKTKKKKGKKKKKNGTRTLAAKPDTSL